MRLFLALVPPSGIRRRLGELADIARAQCGGRRMPDESLHLTLAFLGEQTAERVGPLVDWVRQHEGSPGTWRIDRWGHFRRPGIVWVGGRVADPRLVALHASLWRDLEAMGVGRPPGRFVPHVTLLRHAARFDPGALPPLRLDWPQARLELVHSITDPRGARYESLARSRDR